MHLMLPTGPAMRDGAPVGGNCAVVRYSIVKVAISACPPYESEVGMLKPATLMLVAFFVFMHAYLFEISNQPVR